jgi:hypothetical protein
MSNFAWANPTNGIREQHRTLTGAIGRIQAELKDPKAADFHAVILYQQTPRCRVERSQAYSIAEKKRTRLIDWLRLKFSRSDDEPVETDPAQNDVKP